MTTKTLPIRKFDSIARLCLRARSSCHSANVKHSLENTRRRLAGVFHLAPIVAIWALLAPSFASAALPIFADGQRLPSLAPMVEEVQVSVVNINTTSTVSMQENPMFQDPFFRRFFQFDNDRQRERQAQSLGSGVIVDDRNGYVVTNAHVIENADTIHIRLQNGESREATLVGTDTEADVAVVKIDAEGLDAVPLGDSDELRVGDFVVAVGNPFGLGQTTTSGIVSALGRSLQMTRYENYIQTDASINPGNSGGALVNLRGELIGINTAILSRSGGNQGIGFAIPVNAMRSIVDQLVNFGEVRRGIIGVTIQTLSPELAAAFETHVRRGAVITTVLDDSPAEEAGLRERDIIIEIDGRPVTNASDLTNSVGLVPPGNTVEIVYVRGRRERTAEVLVQSRDNINLGSNNTGGGATADQLSSRLAGARFRDHEADGGDGVLIVSVEANSPAAQSGLVEGDIIVSINQQPVSSIDDMRALVANVDDRLLLQIQRGEGMLFIVVR